MSEFQVGCVVLNEDTRIKMTVAKVNEDGMVTTQWFDANNRLHVADFAPWILRRLDIAEAFKEDKQILEG